MKKSFISPLFTLNVVLVFILPIWGQGGLYAQSSILIESTGTNGILSKATTGLTISSDDTSNPPTAPVNGAGTRLMWIPSRSAFRVGTAVTNVWDASNIGLFSFASGFNTKASGMYATAMGFYSSANGYSALALGENSVADGLGCVAIGNGTNTAQGSGNTAIGTGNTALGQGSVAIGGQAIANGLGSISIGHYSNSTGQTSLAMGESTSATGNYSTAMGLGTSASGNSSMAIGRYNVDNANALLMIGNGTAYNDRKNVLTINKSNGFIGLGTDNPIAQLHVDSYGIANSGVSSFFYGGYTQLGSLALINSYVGVYANYGIVSGTFISAAQNVTASDTRIKNILNRSDNMADLDLLKKIQITNYRMKDEGTWGTKTFKKVIAQEVENVYPEAVSKQKSIIPDIYALAEKVVYDATKKELTVSMQKNYNLKVNENIELIHPASGKIRATIVAVSGNSFTVKDWLYETDKIFVFGREVADFRVVDYEALSMLGISAIQALAKQNDELQQKVKALESRFEKLD